MMRPQLVYRLDRFGRGGDHRAFNDHGYPAIRITEAYENYNRQHQNLRTEGGIEFGDVADRVDFPYAARIIGVDAASLAALAWAPPPPEGVRIRAQGGSTTVSWQPAAGTVAGFRVYWRDTTDPLWTRSRFVSGEARLTLEGILIDDHLFGLASVGPDGNESLVVLATAGR
jgi:hypothetical protein